MDASAVCVFDYLYVGNKYVVCMYPDPIIVKIRVDLSPILHKHPISCSLPPPSLLTLQLLYISIHINYFLCGGLVVI